MKIIYFVLSPWIKKIVVHSEYEKKLVESKLTFLKGKIFIKLHHLLIPKKLPRIKSNKKLTIGYYGPEKLEKPIKPLIDLISADTENKFNYAVFNLDKKQVNQLKKNFFNRNIQYNLDWLSKDDYDFDGFNRYNAS